jgi:hypothetical protein
MLLTLATAATKPSPPHPPPPSPQYWAVVLSVVPPALAVTLLSRRATLRGGAAGDNIKYTPRNTLLYPAACSAAGVVAGLFGLGAAPGAGWGRLGGAFPRATVAAMTADASRRPRTPNPPSRPPPRRRRRQGAADARAGRAPRRRRRHEHHDDCVHQVGGGLAHTAWRSGFRGAAAAGGLSSAPPSSPPTHGPANPTHRPPNPRPPSFAACLVYANFGLIPWDYGAAMLALGLAASAAGQLATAALVRALGRRSVIVFLMVALVGGGGGGGFFGKACTLGCQLSDMPRSCRPPAAALKAPGSPALALLLGRWRSRAARRHQARRRVGAPPPLATTRCSSGAASALTSSDAAGLEPRPVPPGVPNRLAWRRPAAFGMRRALYCSLAPTRLQRARCTAPDVWMDGAPPSPLAPVGAPQAPRPAAPERPPIYACPPPGRRV